MVRGLDHVVVAVRDLAAAAEAWSDLGFVVTPQNDHAWGTSNRLVQVDGFFVELLGIRDEALIQEPVANSFSFGAFNRDFLQSGEGGSMLVLESKDPAADRASFETLGLRVHEPFSFERVANLADGSTAKVGFDLTFLSDEAAPTLGFFTCFNRYPENFWKPEFQVHGNGAREILGITLVAPDPSDLHEFLGGFTGQREMRATSLGLELKTPRGLVTVLSPVAYEKLYGPDVAASLPDRLPAIGALTIGCVGMAERRVYPGTDHHGLTVVLEPLSD
ncbi:hypothetical protein GCM10011316_37500 [Roseibium aquae]|uniref:Glyoxalase-like domain-containing protein n=1 Tax=Roseibium aquae TaxID=1323746 RepID=A0A916TPK2_9HYPH|nr:VOC family protein [Roseibium aquae]GGB62014.1 hypothetical protein GCM10011316_37500 [Roseibium aquae]